MKKLSNQLFYLIVFLTAISILAVFFLNTQEVYPKVLITGSNEISETISDLNNPVQAADTNGSGKQMESNINSNVSGEAVDLMAIKFFLSKEAPQHPSVAGEPFSAESELRKRYKALTTSSTEKQKNTQTFYLSTDGDDLNDGSFEHPWKTVDYACSKLSAGNTLLIRGGTYFPLKPLNPGNSRSAKSEATRIIIRSYNHEKVVIDGSKTYYKNSGTAWGGLINIDNYRSYITIEGLTIQNSPVMGIYIGYYSENVHIRNNYIFHTGASAIFSSTQNNLIEGNECKNNTYLGNHEVISLYNSSNSIVRYNYIHHIGNENNHKNGIAIDIKNGGKNIKVYGNRMHDVRLVGIYIDARGTIEDVEIYDNYLHDSHGNGIVLSSEEEADQTDVLLNNILLHGNIIHNFDRGIVLGWSNTPLNPLQNVSVVNNVCYKNKTHGIELATTPIDNPLLKHAKNIKVLNNLLSKNGRFQIYKHTGKIYFEEYTIDKNFIDGPTNIEGKNLIRGNILNIPGFVMNRGSIH